MFVKAGHGASPTRRVTGSAFLKWIDLWDNTQVLKNDEKKLFKLRTCFFPICIGVNPGDVPFISGCVKLQLVFFTSMIPPAAEHVMLPWSICGIVGTCSKFRHTYEIHMQRCRVAHEYRQTCIAVTENNIICRDMYSQNTISQLHTFICAMVKTSYIGYDPSHNRNPNIVQVRR